MIGNAPPVAPVEPSEQTARSPRAASVRGALRLLLVPALSLLTALIFCAVLLGLARFNPLTVYQTLWTGAITGSSSLAETLVTTTPLILLGLAVALGFKGGLFNIGAEGQYIVGGLGAAFAGHLFQGAPAIFMVSFALLAGALTGALYATIAGVLKVLTGAYEVITTIMLNYVAIDLVSWLVDDGGAMHGPNQIQQSYAINPGAQLPVIWPGTRLHLGFIIALVVAALVYMLIWRTTWGFELRALGLNPTAARSAGVSVRRVTIWVMAASGALSGLAGAIQVTGLPPYLVPDPFGSNFGFDAIGVAIIGAGHPIGIVLAAFLLGALRNGSTLMEQTAGISAPFVSIIIAVVMFFVAAPVVIRWIYFRWGRSSAAAETERAGA